MRIIKIFLEKKKEMLKMKKEDVRELLEKAYEMGLYNVFYEEFLEWCNEMLEEGKNGRER